MTRFSANFIVAIVFFSALTASGCARRFEKAGGPPPDAAVKVFTYQLVPESYRETFSIAATLLANESVEVRAETEGRVLEIGFEEGEPVRRGQVLFRLDDEKIRASLAEAEAAFELAKVDWARAEDMLRARAISRAEYDAARANFLARQATVALLKKQLSDTVITAPFDGVMGPRLVSPGQVVGRLTPLGSLVDQRIIKVEFHVPERLTGRVRPGQPIELRVAAWPDLVFTGTVTFISPQLSVPSRTLVVRAEVPNDEARLKAGMFGRVGLVIGEHAGALFIPESAIIQQGDQAFVYVVGENTRVALRPIRLGVRQPGRVQVIEGLSAGETIVTEGHQKLAPNRRVDAA